jgi:hypothetical protein
VSGGISATGDEALRDVHGLVDGDSVDIEL